MSKNSRSLMFAFMLASATMLTAFTAEQASSQPSFSPLNPDETKTVDYLKNHGVSHFVMLNKQRGELLFLKDGQITQRAKALSGRLSGDNARDDLGVTPAGIFILRPYGDGKHIGFKETGEDIDYSIHTLINPKGQKRPQRLASNSAEFKRISSGCVNASQDTMGSLHKFIDEHQEVFRKEDGSPLVMGAYFVVLPEKEPIQSILKYPDFTVR